jgi:hypothetical protein
MNQRQKEQQEQDISLPSSSVQKQNEQQKKLQTIDMMKAPIIERGRNLGFEVIENYDIYGAGVIHVVWRFKPGSSETLPDMKLGFICITEFSEFSLNLAIARSLFNMIDKLVIVVPTDSMTKLIKDSIESMPQHSLLQLRKYITVLTPSTLVPKTDIEGPRQRNSAQTGELI